MRPTEQSIRRPTVAHAASTAVLDAHEGAPADTAAIVAAVVEAVSQGRHNGYAAGQSSNLRRDILTALRQGGPASPDRLAAQLGASRTGVLQQLRALEAARLVTRQTVRHGVGRPRHLYDVTADAQELFPANYDALAAGLLAAIGSVGGDDLVEEVFQARRRQIGARLVSRVSERLGPAASLFERVRELAAFQDEQGYLCQASTDEDGATRIREHNCAIHLVAMGYPAACRAELQLFCDVLGVEVVRETHIAAGDRSCTYRVTEPPA